MTNFEEINGVRIAYRKQGTGKDVILLHGWGQNMHMMSEIEKHLQPYFSVYNLDFPGFGESGLPPKAWSVIDYTDFLRSFIVKHGIEEPILIAHSFGCRVALTYASQYPVLKMCLTGAAGLKPKLSTKKLLQIKVYKFCKWVLKCLHQEKQLEKLQRNSGSSDYRNAQGVMRETFVKVVNDDVKDRLAKITCETLLVWGEHDDAVPLSMGKYLQTHLANAGLAVFENDGHFAYWNQSERFNRVLDIFLGGGC